jgi:hypothetical protein
MKQYEVHFMFRKKFISYTNILHFKNYVIYLLIKQKYIFKFYQPLIRTITF